MKLSNKLVLPCLALSLITGSKINANPKPERTWAQEFVRLDASYLMNGSIIAGIVAGLHSAAAQASSYKLEHIVDNTFYLKPSSGLDIANAGLAGALSGGLTAAFILLFAQFHISESLSGD